MITLYGKYNEAKVFTDNIENQAISQIIKLLNQEFVKDSFVRIMPDVHCGAGCTIGTTMTISDKIVPNLVGVDIGCGMETVILKDSTVDLEKLDDVIHEYIPAGFATREVAHKYVEMANIEKLFCIKKINHTKAILSIGTLGGGNHFIELDKDDEGNIYLVIHSGSRHLGKQIAEYYQNAACTSLRKTNDKEVKELINELKKVGREKEIQKELTKRKPLPTDEALAYVDGELFNAYLHDMEIAQNYASLNRRAIAEEIIEKMQLTVSESFTTIHNYIDMENKILRKGAVSAKNGERLLIPINMRDGSLVCVGKGNSDWNFSAPHGAGRLMSRSSAKQKLTLEQFEESMQGIYSSTINQSTLDEAPFAYKPIEEIIANIGDSVEIIKTIKPLYNFKAAE